MATRERGEEREERKKKSHASRSLVRPSGEMGSNSKGVRGHPATPVLLEVLGVAACPAVPEEVPACLRLVGGGG